MLRGSLTSDKKDEIGVAGRYRGAHTLFFSGGNERFHTKAVLKVQRLEVPVKVEKALARGVAPLGVKVTGTKHPRPVSYTHLTLPTIYSV